MTERSVADVLPNPPSMLPTAEHSHVSLNLAAVMADAIKDALVFGESLIRLKVTDGGRLELVVERVER